MIEVDILGASDTKFVMSNNWDSATWKQFWNTKVGGNNPNRFESIYTRAGNLYEHKILNAIDENIEMDGQIILEKHLIRVNYDGWLRTEDGTIIYEIKTHKAEKDFEISNAYWQQCQVEMFVFQEMHNKWFLPPLKELYLVSYALNPIDYGLSEDEIVIDTDRIVYHKVKYDKSFIKGEYLPRVKQLAKALRKGKYPSMVKK